jgi:uncharacterized membrane protein YeiH
LCNEIPLIFRKEIYASACLAGGLVFLILSKITGVLAITIGLSMLTVFLIRYFAVKKKWSLHYRVKEN